MKIEINNLTWEIEFVERDSKFLKLDDPDLVNAGITDRHDLKIYIDQSLSDDMIQRTIIHELTHAFIFSYGYSDMMNEEEICKFIESHLISLYKLLGYVKSNLNSDSMEAHDSLGRAVHNAIKSTET